MNRKRHTALKNKILEYLRVIGWIIFIISVIALGQYIAEQAGLMLFENNIFPKILTEGKQ